MVPLRGSVFRVLIARAVVRQRFAFRVRVRRGALCLDLLCLDLPRLDLPRLVGESREAALPEGVGLARLVMAVAVVAEAKGVVAEAVERVVEDRRGQGGG